ncbi:MAG: hypothetical protein ACREHD_17025, partial [Pirellulales bacterium]
REDVAALATWADALKVDTVVCTAKDLVKLRLDRLGGSQLWALAIELAITHGREQLEARLEDLLPQ